MTLIKGSQNVLISAQNVKVNEVQTDAGKRFFVAMTLSR